MRKQNQSLEVRADAFLHLKITSLRNREKSMYKDRKKFDLKGKKSKNGTDTSNNYIMDHKMELAVKKIAH